VAQDTCGTRIAFGYLKSHFEHSKVHAGGRATEQRDPVKKRVTHSLLPVQSAVVAWLEHTVGVMD
jgi:hypothetical protein